MLSTIASMPYGPSCVVREYTLGFSNESVMLLL